MTRRLAFPFLLLALAGGCSGWKQAAYEGSGRDSWQRPAEVIAALGLSPGARVADLGSGTGYFTVPLARAVGPDGRVYAVDVDEEVNRSLRHRVQLAGLANVEVIDARFDDPLLPDGGVDLVFTCNTYHHLDERTAYFEKLRRDLAPGGRVAVLEFDGSSWKTITTWMRHFTERDEIVREMETAGYRLAAEHDLIDRQSFLIFEPR